MKLLSLLLYPFSIFAQDYTLCNNNVLLFIESLSIPPQQLTIQMQGISYKPISDNNTTMSITVFDTPIFTKNIDLCDYTKCPIPTYQTINIYIPITEFPSGPQYNFTIDSKIENKNIFCVNFLFNY